MHLLHQQWWSLTFLIILSANVPLLCVCMYILFELHKPLLSGVVGGHLARKNMWFASSYLCFQHQWFLVQQTVVRSLDCCRNKIVSKCTDTKRSFIVQWVLLQTSWFYLNSQSKDVLVSISYSSLIESYENQKLSLKSGSAIGFCNPTETILQKLNGSLFKTHNEIISQMFEENRVPLAKAMNFEPLSYANYWLNTKTSTNLSVKQIEWFSNSGNLAK